MSVQLLHGDARDVLRTLDAGSVQTVCTSPPYFALRDYQVSGQIGLEPTPAEYVAEMVALFREVRRVLRDDGTAWLNIGDSYAGGGNYRGTHSETTLSAKQRSNGGARGVSQFLGAKETPGCKPKDLIGIPWMLAFALRNDGWYLRADCVWGKPNGMPESITDRPTKSHEYVFLLSKSATYYYDHEAVRTAPKASTQTQLATPYLGQSTKAHGAAGVQDASDIKRRIVDKQRGHSRRHDGFNDRWDAMERTEQIAEGGNLRSVWWISPAQFSQGDHFAVMPNELAEICIRAGSKPGDTVLDPFSGVATTALVARALGRNAIGIELNEDYIRMSWERLQAASPFERIKPTPDAPADAGPLFAGLP